MVANNFMQCIWPEWWLSWRLGMYDLPDRIYAK